MYKKDLALNDLQGLIYHKVKPIQTKPPRIGWSIFYRITFGWNSDSFFLSVSKLKKSVYSTINTYLKEEKMDFLITKWNTNSFVQGLNSPRLFHCVTTTPHLFFSMYHNDMCIYLIVFISLPSNAIPVDK